MNPLDLIGGAAIGLVAGVIAGALGVGGGVVMVPALVLLLGVGQTAAQGTSLLVILPTAVSGAYTHFRHGLVQRPAIVAIGLAGAISAVGGGYLALHLDSLVLRRVFAGYLLLVGFRFVFSGRS